MSDQNLAELRKIVTNFRVSELTVLLSFAGKHKYGRKTELKERALDLCVRGISPNLVIKIHELNKRMSNSGGCTQWSARDSSMSTPLAAHSGSAMPVIRISNLNGFKPTAETVPARTCPPQLGSYTSHLPRPSPSSLLASNQGKLMSLSSHSGLNTTVAHGVVPLHPDVRFKRLPFYDYLNELLKTSSLTVKGNSRLQKSFFSFSFTPQQARDIDRSRYIANELIEEFGLQVLLRFCLAETTCEQQDNFPSSINVYVNGLMAQLPATIPTNKPGVEPKRPGRPVDITHYCKLTATEANRIEVSWNANHITNYCVTITLERRLDSDILMQRLKQKGLKHPDHTRALIKEKLASSSDSEIATTSLRVSLICPLGKMRMTVPLRSTGCSHLQCFDARTFIHMNEKKSSWLCPICDRPAEFNNLFIDGLFTEILSKTFDTNDIEFTASGSWNPFRIATEEYRLDDSNIHVQTIDDGNEDMTSGDCIDLTESDDEEGNNGEGEQRPSHPASPAGSCKSSYSLSSDSTITGSDYTEMTGLNSSSVDMFNPEVNPFYSTLGIHDTSPIVSARGSPDMDSPTTALDERTGLLLDANDLNHVNDPSARISSPGSQEDRSSQYKHDDIDQPSVGEDYTLSANSPSAVSAAHSSEASSPVDVDAVQWQDLDAAEVISIDD